MNQPFKVLCIDDANIPLEIPKELHVVKGEEYHVDDIQVMQTNNVLGFVIREKPLSKKVCFPFEYWGAHRFALIQEQDEYAVEKAIEEMLCQQV